MQLLRLIQSNRPELTFTAFWQKYPRKEAKQDATKAWIELDPDAPLVAEILATIEWQAELWIVVERRARNYMPLPGTYIRRRRWTDEKPVSAVSPAKQREQDAHTAAIDQLIELRRRREQMTADGKTKAEIDAIFDAEYEARQKAKS